MLGLGAYLYSKEDQVSPTETFIRTSMSNANGTLATYLQEAESVHPDLAAGREALSESLGLWMLYAVREENRELFRSSHKMLTEIFMGPDPYIKWKLQPNGQALVTTNALGDDFRIIGALLQAYQLWGTQDYLDTAGRIARHLMKEGQVNGYLTDFHDFKLGETSTTLSLVYVDTAALKAMLEQRLINQHEYDQYVSLLISMPSEGPFVPKSYDVITQAYSYDSSVNILDQLIIAIHADEAGREPLALMDFLRSEFQERSLFYGRYDAQSLEPDVSYESPSAYGLAVLLALQTGDREFAGKIWERLRGMRGLDERFEGGYVFDSNTHIFDNLFPLLAESELN
ncbi:glycosyl hydrolase [Paenibacillus sambharensis]|uniref:Glycosyl hydrolase n=2 Tax=Paenibacillus sambharensis TaxID=1803190 RepID=A0A2W1LX35_9BACL|nr:glycosyl hydrolase [Paenibacillus sambharensis]